MTRITDIFRGRHIPTVLRVSTMTMIDQSAPWGVSLSNYIGRLTTMYTVSGGSNVAAACSQLRPPQGMPPMDHQCMKGNTTEQVAHTYNYAGAVTSVSYPYPSGLAVTTSYDIANRHVSSYKFLERFRTPKPASRDKQSFTSGGHFKHVARQWRWQRSLTSSQSPRLQPCQLKGLICLPQLLLLALVLPQATTNKIFS